MNYTYFHIETLIIIQILIQIIIQIIIIIIIIMTLFSEGNI